MKKVSIYWSLLVGLLTVAAQVITFYVRFGRWNTDTSFLDYLVFLAAGVLGGWILIHFMNLQESMRRRWVMLSTFLLASPLAMIFMLGGGLLGGLGVLIFPQIPWALSVWIGSLVGKLIFKG